MALLERNEKGKVNESINKDQSFPIIHIFMEIYLFSLFYHSLEDWHISTECCGQEVGESLYHLAMKNVTALAVKTKPMLITYLEMMTMITSQKVVITIQNKFMSNQKMKSKFFSSIEKHYI